jgi:hypothetical protein
MIYLFYLFIYLFIFFFGKAINELKKVFVSAKIWYFLGLGKYRFYVLHKKRLQ